MSLRWKIALAMAAITALATVALGAVSYRATRDRLLTEVDRSLVAIDAPIERTLGPDARLPERGPLSGLYAQTVRRDGSVGQSTFPEPLPVSERDLALIGRPRTNVFETVATGAGEFRVRTIGYSRGAVQIGRSLDETNRVLQSLRSRLLLYVALVAAAAIAAGLWIADRVTASLRRLTVAAEHVEATGRLDVAVDDGRADEVGRLGTAFDRMLAALARSKDEQHRLVQDAGHELRTPLTSLRTNLDTLRRFPDLSDADRDAIVTDLRTEADELTYLVNEIVAVASGETSDEVAAPFDLAELVAELAARYERRAGRPIAVRAVPTPVVAQHSAVQRAVSCLLDNACKFDSSGGPIDVSVGDGVVAVADRGPGIPEDELNLVFDRFHRTAEARTMPGSGLGLSIARDVARRHGGDAVAHRRDGGGTVIELRFGHPLPPPAAP
jgi:two-component system sensor histidine kinase MprB